MIIVSDFIENATTQVMFVFPVAVEYGTEEWDIWTECCRQMEKMYFDLLEWGRTTEEAKKFLPSYAIVPEIKEELWK